MTSLARIELPDNCADPMSVAKIFAASGMFKNASNLAVVAAKLIVGRGMGLSDFDAMSGLHLVEGKVVLASNTMAAAIKRNGKYDYRATVTDTGCTIVFYAVDRAGNKSEIGKSSFTMADATRAGLAGKDVWRKYPGPMCFARAISAGYKAHCPDAFACSAPVYVEGEIEADPIAQAREEPIVQAAAKYFDAQVVAVVDEHGTTHHADSAPAVDAESY